MGKRKPLPRECTGDAWCPVVGHIIWRGGGHVRKRWDHIDLTPGQRKTLAERATDTHAGGEGDANSRS